MEGVKVDKCKGVNVGPGGNHQQGFELLFLELANTFVYSWCFCVFVAKKAPGRLSKESPYEQIHANHISKTRHK